MLHLSLCEAAALPSNVEWGLERLKHDFEVKVISSNIFIAVRISCVLSILEFQHSSTVFNATWLDGRP